MMPVAGSFSSCKMVGMRGVSVSEFVEDVTCYGSSVKEFVYRDKLYFMETQENRMTRRVDMDIEIFDNRDASSPKYEHMVSFHGDTFVACVQAFLESPLFDGLRFEEIAGEVVMESEEPSGY